MSISRTRPPLPPPGGGIVADSAGLLWVLLAHAAEDWAKAVSPVEVDMMGNPLIDLDR